MTRLLPPLALLLAGCAGQQRLPTLSERVQCQLDLLSDVVHSVPQDVLFDALMGEPEKLIPHLMGITPEEVKAFLLAWKTCAKPE